MKLYLSLSKVHLLASLRKNLTNEEKFVIKLLRKKKTGQGTAAPLLSHSVWKVASIFHASRSNFISRKRIIKPVIRS
jgi:hypothetical protein